MWAWRLLTTVLSLVINGLDLIVQLEQLRTNRIVYTYQGDSTEIECVRLITDLTWGFCEAPDCLDGKMAFRVNALNF